MTSLPSLEALTTRWESDEALMRSYGATGVADAVAQCAKELREEIATVDDELLSYEEAADESGYSVSHLRRLVGQGHLRDHAESGPTRLRRGHLPRKAGTAPSTPILRTR